MQSDFSSALPLGEQAYGFARSSARFRFAALIAPSVRNTIRHDRKYRAHTHTEQATYDKLPCRLHLYIQNARRLQVGQYLIGK
jgi:hypothetical protein